MTGVEWIGMIGVGLVGMVIAVLLRQYKPEYAVFVSLAVGILIIGMLCSQLLPIFDELKEMLFSLENSNIYGSILRAKGIVQTDNGQWLHFDYVPEEHQVRFGTADYTGRLCVIGSKLDEHGLTELFGL